MLNVQFCPEILLTSDGALKLLQDKQNWYNQLKTISDELNTNCQLIDGKFRFHYILYQFN